MYRKFVYNEADLGYYKTNKLDNCLSWMELYHWDRLKEAVIQPEGRSPKERQQGMRGGLR